MARPAETTTGPVAAIVLAAGLGTRFGGTKQLVVLDDRPLVRHVVDRALDAGVDEVVVVTGYDADEVAAAVADVAAVRTVVNEQPERGMASSLAAGVRALSSGTERAVVLLADQPGIDAELIRAVVAALDGAPAARVRYRDHAGHPVAFRAELFDQLTELRGDVGARELLRELDDLAETPADTVSPLDVDTPADLADLWRSTD